MLLSIQHNKAIVVFIYLVVVTFNLNAKTISWSEIRIKNSEAFYLKDNDIDSGLRINLRLYDQFESPIDSVILSDVLSVTGTLYSNKGNYEKAVDYLLQCLSIRESLNMPKKIAVAQSNLSNLYYKMDNYERAISYSRKSIRNKIRSNSDSESLAISFNSLANIFSSQKRVDSSLKYFNLALEFSSKSGPTRIDALNNLGQIYAQQNNNEKAMSLFSEVISIQRERADYSGLAWTLNHMGKVNFTQENYTLAEKNYKEALEYSRKVKLLDKERDILKSLLTLSIAKNDRAQGESYLHQYDSITKRLSNQKNSKNALELSIQYETVQKEAALKLKEEENKSQNLLIFGLAATLLIIVISVFFFARSTYQKQLIGKMKLQMKEQEMQEVLTQQESASFASQLKGQEQERQRIARDLHDRLGNTLATLRLSIQQDEQATKKIELIDVAVAEVRDVAQNISSGVLAKHGLNTALQELKIVIEQSSKLSFQLFLTKEITKLGQSFSLELYRIVQELTSNTLKHAQASVITLQTNFIEETFHLIYEDNGIGFDSEQVTFGMGIKNIQQRADALGASCHFDAKPNRGTIVIIEKYG